jgi:hypothetical protein
MQSEAKPIIRLSDKTERLTIRCSPELKRAVAIAALDRKTRMDAVCIELLAAGLGLELDRRDKAEAA